RNVFWTIVGLDALGALAVGTTHTSTGIAHLAHIGGVLSGYLFFRVQSLTARRPPARPVNIVRRPVVTPMRVQEAAPELRAPAAVIEQPTPSAPSVEEVDRVLDKISQFGLESLTREERQFLADVA